MIGKIICDLVPNNQNNRNSERSIYKIKKRRFDVRLYTLPRRRQQGQLYC